MGVSTSRVAARYSDLSELKSRTPSARLPSSTTPPLSHSRELRSTSEPDLWPPGREFGEAELQSQCQSLSFAVFAGVEYADKPSTMGWSDRYRTGIDKLVRAGRHWAAPGQDIKFAINLGDTTAGNDSQAKSERDLLGAVHLIRKLATRFPVYTAFGNEASLATSSKVLLTSLGLEGTYYSRELPSKWRLIVLDTKQPCTPNPSAKGGSSPREAVGVGEAQLAWLRAELKLAEDMHERVIIAAHDPLTEDCSSQPGQCIGNTIAVQEVILGSKATEAVLCGHDRRMMYCRKDGVHFLNLPPMGATPAVTIAPYMIIKIEANEIFIQGYGGIASRLLYTRSR